MPRILMIVSSASEMKMLDGSPHETGVWAEELYKPFVRFRRAGIDVDVATPGGKPPTLDPYSLEAKFHYPDPDDDFLQSVVRSFAHDPEDVRLTLDQMTTLDLVAAKRACEELTRASRDDARKIVEAAAKTAWQRGRSFIDVLAGDPRAAVVPRARFERVRDEVLADSQKISDEIKRTLEESPTIQKPLALAAIGDADAARYDAVFVPGGHGPMVDLVADPDVGRVIAAVFRAGRTVATLCHGPAALLSVTAKNSDGGWLFEGFKMCVFTDEEEHQTKPGKLGVPWYLEAALKNRGGIVDEASAEWQSHVVVDRNLVTAQNPASAEAAADVVIRRVRGASSAAAPGRTVQA